MKENKYQWQGEPVKVKFGNCIVNKRKDNPLWWWNYECELSDPVIGVACIPSIEVTTKEGNSFLLSNHGGIGVHKLSHGGWPGYQHFSLKGSKFSTSPQLKYDNFDLEAFTEHEKNRDRWQKENFPKEYEKMQSLRQVINKRS